jgi:hypothetical protein
VLRQSLSRSQRRPLALLRVDLWSYPRCKRRIAMTTQSATEAIIAYAPNEPDRRDHAVAVSLVIGMGA